MNDIKSVVAANIVKLRTANKMTQYELAQRLNYSDKAVSKWERAESLPDVSTLVELADIFEISLDDLLRNENLSVKSSDGLKKEKNFRKGIVVSVIIVSIWFVALLAFVMISLIAKGKIRGIWLSFIYAVPVSLVVWLIFNSIWSKPRLNYFIISLLIWSVLATVFITLLLFGINIWMIMLLGIPSQIVIILCSLIKKRQNNDK